MQNTNIAIEYDYYTLEQAREIIREENRQKAIKRAQRKAERAYYIKQKLLGLAAVGISVAELLAGYSGLIDEGGAFLFMLPLGLYALFTKEKICIF